MFTFDRKSRASAAGCPARKSARKHPAQTPPEPVAPGLPFDFARIPIVPPRGERKETAPIERTCTTCEDHEDKDTSAWDAERHDARAVTCGSDIHVGAGVDAPSGQSAGPSPSSSEPRPESAPQHEGISSYHPKIRSDAEFIRDRILRGVGSDEASRAVVDLLHAYERWDNEISASRSEHGYANLSALFAALARMGAIDTGSAFFTHYRAPLDILWFDLNEPWRAEYQSLYRLTPLGHDRAPTADTNYGQELAKQEAIGVLGMLKGIGLGIAGLVDDARFALGAQGGTNAASEALAAEFDDAGSWWFGRDWSEGEAVLLGLSAAEIGELGGSLVFTLATFEVKSLEFAQRLLTLPAMARGIDNSIAGLRKVAAEDAKLHRELYSDPRVWQELINIAGMVLGLLLSKTQRGQRIGTKLAHFLLDSAPIAPIAGKMIEALLSDASRQQKEREIAFAFSELLRLVATLGRAKIANRPLRFGSKEPVSPAPTPRSEHVAPPPEISEHVAPPPETTSGPQPSQKPRPKPGPRKKAAKPQPWKKPARRKLVMSGEPQRGPSPGSVSGSTQRGVQDLPPAHVIAFVEESRKGSSSTLQGGEKVHPQLAADPRAPGTVDRSTANRLGSETTPEGRAGSSQSEPEEIPKTQNPATEPDVGKPEELKANPKNAQGAAEKAAPSLRKEFAWVLKQRPDLDELVVRYEGWTSQARARGEDTVRRRLEEASRDLARKVTSKALPRIGEAAKATDAERAAGGASPKTLHDLKARREYEDPTEKVFHPLDSKEILGSRRPDDVKMINGERVIREMNNTPWSKMSEKTLRRKLVQVGSDFMLLKNGQVDRVEWDVTEPLPDTGLGGQLRRALEKANQLDSRFKLWKLVTG